MSNLATQKPSGNSADLILKAIPVVGLLIYLLGFMIRLVYFRSINVHCIDFLKAQCFETGMTFIVLSLSLVSLVLLPLMVLISKLSISPHGPNKHSSSAKGVAASMVMTLLAIITSTIVVLFVREVRPVLKHFIQMLCAATIFVLVIILLNNIGSSLKRWAEKDPLAKLLYRHPGRMSFVGDSIRFIFLSVIVWHIYFIFFVDMKNGHDLLIALINLENLPYLLFLLLFSLAIARLIKRLMTGSRNEGPVSFEKNDGATSLIESVPVIQDSAFQNKPEDIADDHDAENSRRYWSAFRRPMSISLFSIWSLILLYLLVISYVHGPFLSIPTSRGGGMQYSEVKLILVDPNDSTNFPFVPLGEKVSSDLFLLSEDDTWVWVVPCGKLKNPIVAFRDMCDGKTYSIKKTLISGVVFNKVQ